MIGWRRIIPAVLAALAVAGVVRADLLPSARPDAQCRQPADGCSQTSPAPARVSDLFAYWATDIDLNLPASGFVPRDQADAGQAGQAPRPQLLVEDQSSLGLFLYALMGLGLWRSASCVKKFSCDLIPDWYHNSGPFQVGHSHAVGPDLCLVPMYCFVQPVCQAQDCQPQYCRGTIGSLIRKSQFTPTTLASRGPPNIS
jgi:hypothetical protein